MKIIITGGSNGLGYELSKQLEGSIHVLDIKKPKNPVQKVNYHKIDVSNEDEVKNALNKIGDADVVINNAGIMRRGNIYEITNKEFENSFNVNVKSSWLVSKYVKLNKKGVLVFINSRHGDDLKTNPAIYSLTKKCAAELAKLFKLEGRNVKIAYLGPFNGGVSKEGLTEKEYEKRNLDSVKEVAEKVVKLIKSSKEELHFNEKNKEYYFK